MDEDEIKVNKKDTFPKAVFFILGNEFCERFTFYGMHSILTLYLREELKYGEDTTTSIFHAWTLLAYFTPLLGASLADSWIGKFRTIFYFSIIYSIGNVMTSIGSFPNKVEVMKTLSFIGLFTVAIATGGIKPCVSAFGGDQYSQDQVSERKLFFSIFYFTINIGSLFTTIISPILRTRVKCLGSNTCYPLAFGVSAILMITATVVFFSGKALYKNRIPKQNVLVQFGGLIIHALAQRWKSKEKDKEHWLDYAEDKYDTEFIQDAKYVLRTTVLMLPLPVFWALFDQQGSRWPLQAKRLDGNVNGFKIFPDQMHFINPALILVLIPLFEYAIYPAFNKINILTTPLQRVTTGGFLAAFAFLITGFLELAVEENLSKSEYNKTNNNTGNLIFDEKWRQVKLINTTAFLEKEANNSIEEFLSSATNVLDVSETTSISILYQIPQFVVITVAEILFSISGLEFAYSQAPMSMKSVLSAIWLLTTALGNLIIIVISGFHMFDKQSWEFFAFSIIMALDMVVFGVMAHFYQYVNIHSSTEVQVNETREEKL